MLREPALGTVEMSDVNATASTTAGKYRVLTELGSGGMACVYLAVSQGLAGFSKLVVLKVLKSDLAGTPELCEAFLREARLCARMNHANVVAANEVEVFDGLPVIVMEYLQGQPFSSVLRRVLGKVSVDLLLRILVDSLNGLHYAHELTDFDGAPLRLVHRDFSPQNIFITYDGSVKVLDFGVAQVTRHAAHPESDSIQGKLRYMAPEQVRSASLDRRTDVFAAGILLCELVTERRFWGEISDAAVLDQLKSGDIPSPRSLMPAFPAELERICATALAYEREDRYQTVAEMQSDIEAYMAAHSMRVTSPEIGRRIAEWFDVERVQAQRLIESHLSNDTYVSWSRITTTSPGEFASRTPPHASATLTVRDLPRSSALPREADPSPVRRRTKRAVGALALLVALGAGVLGFRSVTTSSHVTPASPPAVVPHPPEPKNVTLRITAFPATATIAIDDLASVENPYVRAVPPDDGWHELRVEALGHKPSVQRIQFQHDLELVVSLESEPTTQDPQPTTATGAKRPVSLSHPQSPTRDTTSCSPPYTYDPRGVKHFKPECL